QLTQGKDREQQTDRQRRRAERLGVERQQRDDDPETDEIDEDGEEDDEKRARHGAANTIQSSTYGLSPRRGRGRVRVRLYRRATADPSHASTSSRHDAPGNSRRARDCRGGSPLFRL